MHSHQPHCTITLYSPRPAENIVTLIKAFEEYTILDVIPRKEMILNYFKKASPDIFIINTNRIDFSEAKHLIGEVSALKLVISEDLSPEELFNAFRFGVLGYINERINPVNLFNALSNIRNEELYISKSALKMLIDSFKLTDQSTLTIREKEILQLLKTGKTYSMIANDLFLSGNTIRSYMQRIYYKLNANSKAEAIEIATNNKII
ncbi:MAG: response regulator transcription factor [Chitinophagales bacterium]